MIKPNNLQILMVFVLLIWVLDTPLLPAQDETTIIISDIAWSPDETLIAVGLDLPAQEGVGVAIPGSNNVPLLNLETNARSQLARPDQSFSVTSIDFNLDGSQLTASGSSEVEIWDVQIEQRLETASGVTIFRATSWNPEGEKILAVTPRGVRIYSKEDLLNPILIFVLPDEEGDGRFTDSVWSPDGRAIVSSVDNGHIYVWDTNDEMVLQLFTGHTAPVRKVVWNPHTNLIASGDDSGIILVWNPTTGAILAQLDRHTGAIHDLDWRPDGQQIASVGADNTLRVWDWPSGAMQIVAHSQPLWSVAYSPGGRQLAVGGEIEDIRNPKIEILPVPKFDDTPIQP